MAPTNMACLHKRIVQCGNSPTQKSGEIMMVVLAFQIVSITEKRMARGDERNQSTSLLMGTAWAALWSCPVEDRIHHAGMDGLLRNCATGCRVDEAFTMDDLVDSISADTSGLRCGHVQLRIVFITPVWTVC
ncbi:hypothetical protein DPX16_17635 [Anabarilius grahami]|uniref:Uncharacterized protein n=1 Tax=Anabarilius grahami TaxID=495550 RepID=A0A3N0YGZ0_ANAGA|nr:hypothetical protein DPX16_17635 [Anabarilius grahami]